MPYTLMKGLVWVLLAVVLGIVIGWLLRSVAAKRQVERARAANLGTADRDELERLRRRVSELEPVAAERDRLPADVDGPHGADPPPPVGSPATAVVLEPVPDTVSTPATVQAPDATLDTPTHDTTTPDIGAAAAVIGKRIVTDDLTAVEGIGPKIAELCRSIGINTWSDLAETEVSLLRTMLNDAGQRFKAHDPSSWPQQAALLAAGAWSEFAEFTERLDGGRPVG